MTEEQRELTFYVVYPIKLLLGILVFNANIFVFSIFSSKKKKSPSDYLIIPNLFVDSLHGLGMCIPFYLLGPKLMINGTFVYQFFTLFSLIMLILMTINRYVAVRRPFKYRKWFKKRFIIVSFLSITSFVIGVFALLAYLLFLGEIIESSFEEFCDNWVSYYHDWRGYYYFYDYYDSYDYNFDYSFQYMDLMCSYSVNIKRKNILNAKFFVLYIWPQFQLLLVSFITALMCFVYYRISDQFHQRVKLGIIRRFFDLISRLFVDNDAEDAKQMQNKNKSVVIRETDCTPQKGQTNTDDKQPGDFVRSSFIENIKIKTSNILFALLLFKILKLKQQILKN